MSVSTGQVADATTFNDAFVSKNTDSTVISVITLNESGSGPQVDNIQQAINDNDDAITNHVADVSGAHAASAISNAPLGNLAATDVQTALDELQTDVDSRATAADITAAKARANHTGTQLASTISDFDTAADARISNARGAINGVASLDGSGLVPTSQLPSYVDDVLEYADLASFPVTGETGKIYVAIDTGLTYRWSGAVYINISSGAIVSVNGQTGVVVVTKTDVGLSNVDNTSDATKNSAVAVLTNKDIDGGTATDARRITLPKETKANLDALTRKEGTIVYATDQAKAYIDNGISLVPVGSGSGSGGGINYISNPGFEDGTVNGWTGYDDGASSRPTDGTGGTATGLTMTASSTTPLRDTYSALIAKDAANRQGKGHSFDFSIAREDRFSILSIEVPALVTSGSYNPGTDTTDSDLIAYLYDVTNARLIEPSGFRVMANSTFPTRNRMTFQATDSTSYRLIFHVATTSASAWTMQVDDISVGPQVLGQGSPAQYLGALATSSTWVTNATHVGKYWRTNDGFLEADVTISLTGAPTAASLILNLPSSLSIDSDRQSTIGSSAIVGSGIVLDSGSTLYKLAAKYETANSVRLMVAPDTGSGFIRDMVNSIDSTTPMTFANADTVTVKYRVPIVGWAGPTIMSSAAALPVIAAKYSLTSNETTAANADHIMTNFTTRVYDKSGAVSGSTFTAQEPGLFRFRLRATTTSIAWTTTDVITAFLVKNGATQFEKIVNEKVMASFTDRLFLAGEGTLELNARDTVQLNIRNQNSGAVPVIDSAGFNYWEIEKLPSRQQIAASETMLVRANGSTTTVNNTTPTVIFPTVNKSTHGSAIYNPSTGVFTVQAPGDIEVTTFLRMGSVAWAANDALELYVYKNGSQYSFIDRKIVEAAGTRVYAISGSDVVTDCVQGDQIEIKAFASVSNAINANSYVIFKRLGGIG